jgi:(p)ppGpp synthase/HD superfamily hydrolase
MIAAGILHDVLEGSDVTEDKLRNEFGYFERVGDV